MSKEYTREQNIEVIRAYFPGKGMKLFSKLFDIAVKNTGEKLVYEYKWWEQSDDMLAELARLCVQEEKDF